MTLKEKIKSGKKIIGMHVQLGDVSCARIAGLAGYDFVWVDLEHTYISLEALQGHIIAIQAGGTAVIVRVPQDDLTYTKKVLEMGVDGVIFPMIHTPEQAAARVSSTLYPPYGTRGFGPMHAVHYGFKDTAAYIANTVDELCRFVQIEHTDAVNCLDELLKNEYIDCFVFGPCDLSGSINQLGDVYGEDNTALIRQCVAKIKAAGRYCGVSTGDVSDFSLNHWHDMGMDMISAGSDYGYIQEGALKNRIRLERMHKEADA